MMSMYMTVGWMHSLSTIAPFSRCFLTTTGARIIVEPCRQR